MRRTPVLILAGFVLFLVTSLVAWFLWPEENTKAPTAVREDVYRYSFTVHNTAAKKLDSPSFLAYAPAHIPGLQETLYLDASVPFKLIKDAAGNQVMVFQVDWLPPYGTRVITVTAKIRRYSRWQAVDSWQPPRQIAAGKYMTLDDPAIQDAAHVLARKTIQSTAQAVLGYLTSQIKPVDYIREDRGAAYALREGRGDCTEFMYAFSALMRVNGGPTLNFGGFLTTGTEILHSSRYHNWAAYGGENGWVMVDPEQGLANVSGHAYLIFRIFYPAAPHPLSNTHRFVSMDEALEVTFN